MSEKMAQDRFASRPHKLVTLISYLVIFVAAFRRVNELDGFWTISLALALIGIFTLLFASQERLSRRFKAYPRIYFAIQIVLVLIVGLLQDYIDGWALLFIALGFQVAARCSRREALIWACLIITSTLATLSFEFGLISGLGRALAYTVIGVFLVSYDIQYSQHEAALEESQMLLAELQEAHAKLQAYAAQADRLAAAQERNRMIQELYDGVGQKVFAIQLSAEATRLMLEKDPARAVEQLVDLQEQTQSALGQMRQLIGQWRPG